MNSGSLKDSVSSRVYNLSIYFKCILVLTSVSFSIKILLERGVYVICWFVLWFAQMHGERLVLVVRIIVRVILQKYMDFLEKKCVSMIGNFEYLLALLGLLISNFGKFSKYIFYEEILCLR